MFRNNAYNAMRILFVAMADSIHTARWIAQVAKQGWDLHLFPATPSGLEIHPDLANVSLHHKYCFPRGAGSNGVRYHPTSPGRRAAELGRRQLLKAPDPACEARRLARVIEEVRPDIVHSLEIQHAGYLVSAAKPLTRGPFPRWIVTNWGSDIYLFGRLPEHAPKIREVLAACDFYSCECHRDVALARRFGFAGEVLPVFPNTGGFDLELMAQLRQPGPASGRRLLVLKGYQGWAGRALVALRALERCADVLAGYEIAIHSAVPEVEIAAELFRQATGIPVVIVPKGTPHREILSLHGRARISTGLSISDAISTSLLEAIAMGSFPIQSWTACADEWIEDGVTGILVPPDDPEVVEAALRHGLSDDTLIDGAAERNIALAADRLERGKLRRSSIGIYTGIMSNIGRGRSRHLEACRRCAPFIAFDQPRAHLTEHLKEQEMPAAEASDPGKQ